MRPPARSGFRVFVGMAGALALVLAACGDDGASTTTNSGPSASAETVAVDVYFVDQEAFNVGTEPYARPVERDVPADDPIQGALDALFEGPTGDEGDMGLVLVTSGATGIASVSVTDGIAEVRLAGGCNSGGSTLTVATEIFPTVRQFDGVEAVKILDPDGTTQFPDDRDDSIPECLEP